MEYECKRCGGGMDPKQDFLFDIEYLSCSKCGYVEFVDDGLGLLRYSLNKDRKNGCNET